MLDLAERPPVVPRPWTRQYDPGVPAALDDPAVRLDGLLHRTAQRYPAYTALDFFGRRTTYRALDEVVDRIAIGLRRLGLESGERIALFLPNCPQLVIGFQAIWRAGCVVVPTNPRATVPEFVRQLADAGASAAFVADPATLDGVADIPPSVRHLIASDPLDDLPLPLRLVARLRRGARIGRTPRRSGTSRRGDLPGPGAPRITSFHALVGDGAAIQAASTVGPDDPAALLYTGGTTGLPKAAVLTHRNLVANACQLGAWASSLDDGSEVMLSALPLVHGYAMTACMNVAILRGWTQVLVPDPRDIDRLLAAIERTRVTVFPGVPTLYAAICGHPSVTSGRRDLHSIEACISGAATLPRGVQEEFERLTHGRVVEGYGLTEASPATHCNPLGRRGRSGSIGLPLPDTDCRLVDVETETTPVEPGRPGVLCVRGPQVMAGYWQRPRDTSQVLRRDDDGRTWLHTGDVAAMDDDGYFRIVDRKKDVIVAAGGLKVYPNEIEDVLSTHPKVRLSAVIGVPVGGADQRAKAFVVLRDGARADDTEILEFLAARIAPYKLPKAIEFRSELPLAFTGKVLRRVLADEERRAAAPAEPAERPERAARAPKD
jgi:long-chain acyl-CoA synthetase